jgi:hypothetical protein
MIWLMMPMAIAAQSPEQPLSIKSRIAALHDLIGEPSLLRDALNKLKEGIEADLPSSMMDEKTLDQVEQQTTTLNRIVPDPLPALDTPKAIRSLAAKGATAGTLTGSQEELRNLRGAADKRATEISNLKDQRDEATKLVDKYKQDADVAQKLADEIGEKMLTPEIEIIGRLKGKSVALSWADLETELVPALRKRQEAAEGVVARYSTVIQAAEKDLAGFKDALTFGAWIFSGDNVVTGAAHLDPRSLPGVSADTIAHLEQEMTQNTKAAEEVANQMRQEAADIRKHNAEIAGYQAMLGAISSGVSAADSIKGGSNNGQPPKVQVVYSKIEYKWQTIINGQPVPIRRH